MCEGPTCTQTLGSSAGSGLAGVAADGSSANGASAFAPKEYKKVCVYVCEMADTIAMVQHDCRV